jgi:hypothetical protein
VNLAYYLHENILSEVLCVFRIPGYSRTPRANPPVVLAVNGIHIEFPLETFVLTASRA